MKPLYIETTIRCEMAELWRLSQDPACHERWDLRFTHIKFLSPGRFTYSTTVLPGLTIDGIGVTVGERVRPDGTCTSALRFGTNHPLSMIKSGSGYWRYVPTGVGIRFLTGYDYRPGLAAADLLFRPLLGWATAWSFDRLRLWAERGITPRRSLVNALATGLSRITVVLLIAAAAPLIAAADPAMAVAGHAMAVAGHAMAVAGPAMAVAGHAMAVAGHAMAVAGHAMAVAGPAWTAAITSVAVALTALAVALLPVGRNTPSASRCLRRPPDRLARTAPSSLDTLELS